MVAKFNAVLYKINCITVAIFSKCITFRSVRCAKKCQILWYFLRGIHVNVSVSNLPEFFRDTHTFVLAWQNAWDANRGSFINEGSMLCSCVLFRLLELSVAAVPLRVFILYNPYANMLLWCIMFAMKHRFCHVLCIL